MNNISHLGEFKIIGNDKKYDFLLFDRYTSVDFILDNDIIFKLEGGFIQSVSYTSNSNMVIRLLSFSPFYSQPVSFAHQLKQQLEAHPTYQYFAVP